MASSLQIRTGTEERSDPRAVYSRRRTSQEDVMGKRERTRQIHSPTISWGRGEIIQVSPLSGRKRRLREEKERGGKGISPIPIFR